MLGNGVANDDVAFWDVPGHSGRVGSEVSDCHIHRRWRPVYRRQCVNRLPGSTPRLALVTPHLLPFYSPARTKPRSQLTSRRTVGLRYGERGISEAMVPTESTGRHPGIRLTSRRGSWRWQELGGGRGSRTCQKAQAGSCSPSSPHPTAALEPPFPLALPTPAAPRRPQFAPLLCPHPPPPVLAVGQASGGCSVPRGRPIADSVALSLPHPGAGPARRAARDRAAGRDRRRSGCGPRGRGAPEPPELGLAAQSVLEQGAVPARPGGWPGSLGREAVRLPPPAPAARCDRPGAPAAVFCRAGLGRSAAARPGRAGPPRPAGVLAAVITAPPTRFFRGSSHDPLIGGLQGPPSLLIPAPVC